LIPAQRFRPPDGGNAPTPTAPSARKAQAGKNSFPQTPFLFARLFAGFARFFGGRAIIKFNNRPCPTAPVRGRQ